MAESKLVTKSSRGKLQTMSSRQRAETLLEFVAKMFLLTKERYLHTPISKRQAELWQQDWMRLAEQVGVTRFKEAVETVWLRCKYFPLPAEIAEHVPPVEERAGSQETKQQLAEISELKRRFEAGDPDVVRVNFSAMLDEALKNAKQPVGQPRSAGKPYIPSVRELVEELRQSELKRKGKTPIIGAPDTAAQPDK